MNATPETFRTAAAGSHADIALLRAVAALGTGWTVLSDCQVGEDQGEARARVRYALLHPDVGIALLDTLPGATTVGAPDLLRRSLEAAGFRAAFGGCPPIVYLCVPSRALFGLDDLLTEQFDLLPPLALSGGSAWVVAAQGMLSVHPPLRYPWQGTAAGQQSPRRGWSAGLRFLPRSIPGPRGLAAFWSAVALVLGGGVLFLQYLGPPEAPVALAHVKPGAARAQVPEASPASASLDQPRRPPSPGPVLAVWPSGSMPRRVDAARASFAFREAEGAAGVAEPGAKAGATLAGLDATGSDAETADGASGPTHVGDGSSSIGDAEAESGSAQAETAPSFENAPGTGGPAQADRAAAADSPPPTTSKFGATEPTPEPEGNFPNRRGARSADSAPARVKAQPATAPAASAEAPAPDDHAGTDAASKPEAAVEMTAEPSADPNVAAPRTATPSPDGATPPVATADPASPRGSSLGEAPASPPLEPSAPPAVAAVPLEVPPSLDAGQPATAPPSAPRAEPPTEARSPTSTAVAPAPADRAAAPRPSGDEATSRPAPALAPVARPAATPRNAPPERTAEPAQPAAGAPVPRPVVPEPGGGTQAPAPTQAAATERRSQATPLPPALVEALVTRGDAMMSRRDVSAARLLYERAAAAGEARAATALAKTYDPDFLAEIGAQGIRGDAAIAAAWYRKANSLGDSGALARAEALSGRDRPAEGRP